ncbi:DUF3265 domain-containing protein [Vibrio vulnificus]|nr:DUF3265 domain-containing protein [Vibrio vulnificus]
MSFGGEGGLQKLGLCGTHPLTQRYVEMSDIRIILIARENNR